MYVPFLVFETDMAGIWVHDSTWYTQSICGLMRVLMLAETSRVIIQLIWQAIGVICRAVRPRCVIVGAVSWCRKVKWLGLNHLTRWAGGIALGGAQGVRSRLWKWTWESGIVTPVIGIDGGSESIRACEVSRLISGENALGTVCKTSDSVPGSCLTASSFFALVSFFGLVTLDFAWVARLRF
jgi:hypothetical protein